LEVRTLEARLAAAREELDVQEAKIQQMEAKKKMKSDVSRQLLRTENRLKAESAKLENLNRLKEIMAPFSQ
jgi:exonuclease VII large subunit